MPSVVHRLPSRIDEANVDDVRDTLWKQRTLAKTWLMRGTLHLVPAEDLPIYTASIGLAGLVSVGSADQVSAGILVATVGLGVEALRPTRRAAEPPSY